MGGLPGSSGGKGGGGSGGGGGGGFNPNAMFANEAMPGMYGGDPSAQPQFSDASVLTDPQTGMAIAMGGGSQDFSSFLPQGPNPNDVGGTQSDPNTPMPQFGSQAQAAGTSPNTGIAQLVQALNQQRQQSQRDVPGPKGWEPGADVKPWSTGTIAPEAEAAKGNREGAYNPPATPSVNENVASRFGSMAQGAPPAPGPLTQQMSAMGAQPLTDQLPSDPASAARTLPQAAAPGPLTEQMVELDTRDQPQAPPTPQGPQRTAVEPQAPRRREEAAAASEASAGQPPPSQDPIKQFLHNFGLDFLIPQVGGNYNIPEADRRTQQYGLGDILQRAGNVANVAAGRQPNRRSSFAPEGMGSSASPYWGGQRRPSRADGMGSPASPYWNPQAGGGAYNPQTFTRALWSIEGGGRTGSNVGKAQFGPEEIRRYGNPNDPRSVEREAVAIQNNLRPALGRNPEPWEMYLTHQQGMSGGRTLLTADRNMPAWQAIRHYYKSDAMAKRAITGNLYNELKGVPAENITVGMFRDWWQRRFNRELARIGGGTVAQAQPGARTRVPTDAELNLAP